MAILVPPSSIAIYTELFTGSAIMQKLADQDWNALYGLLTFLIEDLKNGAAVLE
jgi:hypothetical protein